MDLVLVKNYKSKATTETVKVQGENLIESLQGFRTNTTTSCLVDGLRRAISLLVNDFGEILVLNSTFCLLESDSENMPFDNLPIGNNLQEIGIFLRKNGIQVSLVSTLKGYSVLENWTDLVSPIQDYSPPGSALVVKLTPFLANLMIKPTSAPTTPLPTSGASLTPGVISSTPLDLPNTNMNLQYVQDVNLQNLQNGSSNNANLAFLQSQMQAYQQHVAKNQNILSSQEEEVGKINCLWSGLLSWKGIDPNTNLTREISCNVMAVPVHKRDLSD